MATTKSKVLFPHNVPIADAKGNPSSFFTRQLKILLDEKQNVSDAAAAAQATADAAVPTSALLTQLLAAMGGDPGVTKLVYWDHATNTYKFLGIGSNLSITSGTLNASGGGGGSLPWYFKAPTAANFSTMYASLRGGSVTNAFTVANDASAGMSYKDTSADNGYMKAMGRPIPLANQGPGTTFTITVHIMANTIAANQQYGIWARCSSTKYVFFNLFNRGGSISIQRAFFNTTWSDGVFSNWWDDQDAWLRIAISNQTTSYYVSRDGKNWVQLYTTENLLSAAYTDYGFCMGRFDTVQFSATCDHLTSDEYP